MIHAQGTIMGAESGINPVLGTTMGYRTVIRQIQAAREDDDVAAIVIRVDSPGGDSYASDLMGHEVERAVADKPVVISMVDVAASGGYYISYKASHIVADRSTATGSIGSITGKMNTAPAYARFGVTFDSVERGPNATIMSDHRGFTPEQRARFEEDHWAGFNIWLEDVAKHRDMTFEQAERLAHGRVWSGRQAKENGLVDELGVHPLQVNTAVFQVVVRQRHEFLRVQMGCSCGPGM